MSIPRNGLPAWFVDNPVAANLLMVFIIIAGGLTAVSIRKEFIPELATGAITINVAYPGASPADVEQGLLIKIEQALDGLDGIKRIIGHAHENAAEVRVELRNDADPDLLIDSIRARIDALDTLPAQSKKPVVAKEIMRSGVIWLVLSGPLDEGQIKVLARRIETELLQDANIRQVEIHGVRDNQIAIEVSEKRLRQYDLTLQQVADAVRAHSMNLPAGALKSQGGDLLVRTMGQADSGSELAAIIIKSSLDGDRVPLGQVARITDGFEESEWFLRHQGRPAVGIQVLRTGDQSTLAVARAVHDYIARKRPQLPAGVDLVVGIDTSRMLSAGLNLMLANMLWGAALVFAALLLFLRARVALWVMTGIPVSILGAVWLMPSPPIDASINMITIFGFILVLGILVDDAIVIGENVHATIEREGQSVDSVIKGVREVAVPATFGVLTTVAAFSPMVMLPGVNGKLWRGIALVVIIALLFSLIESKLILPAHLAHPWRRKNHGRGGPLWRLQKKIDQILASFVARVFRPVAGCLLARPCMTLAGFIVLLLICVAALKGGHVRMVFFPEIEQDMIWAELTMAAGICSGQTLAATQRIEAAAAEVNAALRRERGMTEDAIQHLIAFTSAPGAVGFYAELLPAGRRDVSAREIIRHWRECIGAIAGVARMHFQSGSADAGEAIHFELYSRDEGQLRSAAQELKDQLGRSAGVYDVRDSAVAGKPELRLSLKPQAHRWGLSTSDLAWQVRRAVHGEEIQTLQRGKDEVKVLVRYPLSERGVAADLFQMRITAPDGNAVPLALVAQASFEQGPAQIERSDGQRVLHVMAGVDKSQQTPDRIIAALRAEKLPELLSRFPDLTIRLGGEAREQDDTLATLQRGVVLALFAIYALLALPLRSYAQPLIIMTAIPFGLVGSICGHWVMGLPVSVLSLCGMVALAGVAVNDSLVLVSFINTRRTQGLQILQAARDAGADRFRAVMLTTLTTVCGLLPMLLERSLEAQYLIPMAVSLAFGLLFTTTTTLVLVPAIYLIGHDLAAAARKIGIKRLQKG
jgi:multidrug efflux pump subunit AcrB